MLIYLGMGRPNAITPSSGNTLFGLCWGYLDGRGQALGLIDGNEALAIFGLGQFLLGYIDAQDAVFEFCGNVVF